MALRSGRIIHKLGSLAGILAARGLHRYRVRRLLRELDPRSLADLGMSGSNAGNAKWSWER